MLLGIRIVEEDKYSESWVVMNAFHAGLFIVIVHSWRSVPQHDLHQHGAWAVCACM